MATPVRVYLCRHAHAAPGTPDHARPLTAEGRVQARALGRQLVAAAPRPSLVLSSPVLRAHQTAEALARMLGLEPRLEAGLAPGATVVSLIAAVGAEPGHAAVAVVGHQPDCSEIMEALTGVDPGFAPGAVHAVDLDA
jgi:phosphohistidine phosphatase